MRPQPTIQRRVSKWNSAREGLIAAGALAVLLVARALTPSASGAGTHEQLGLPACPLLHLTGVPCPTCGYTTSFAYATRGQFSQALWTQPAGFLLFCLTVISIPISLYLLYRRSSWTELLATQTARRLFYVLLTVMALGWVYKIVATK